MPKFANIRQAILKQKRATNFPFFKAICQPGGKTGDQRNICTNWRDIWRLLSSCSLVEWWRQSQWPDQIPHIKKAAFYKVRRNNFQVNGAVLCCPLSLEKNISFISSAIEKGTWAVRSFKQLECSVGGKRELKTRTKHSVFATTKSSNFFVFN